MQHKHTQKHISYRVHFKVDQLPSCEGDNHLSLIHSTADNSFFTGSLPLIHTLVCSDVTDTVWVHLYKQPEDQGRKNRKKQNKKRMVGLVSSS